MKRPIITLLTDFGARDHYVAAMKGVILGICPEASLVDITHQIEPFAISEAAYTLAQAWTTFPAGTVHLVVVDPGVGSSRRALAAEAEGHQFVAPDNGVLGMIPIRKTRELTAERYFRKPVSQTFHGRDVFAPVAAQLALGLAASKLGPLVREPIVSAFAPPVRDGEEGWIGSVIHVDRFGNIVTSFDRNSFAAITQKPFHLQMGNHRVSQLASSYAEAPDGGMFAIWGSSGYLEVSINKGSAAQQAGGGPVRLRFNP